MASSSAHFCVRTGRHLFSPKAKGLKNERTLVVCPFPPPSSYCTVEGISTTTFWPKPSTSHTRQQHHLAGAPRLKSSPRKLSSHAAAVFSTPPYFPSNPPSSASTTSRLRINYTHASNAQADGGSSMSRRFSSSTNGKMMGDNSLVAPFSSRIRDAEREDTAADAAPGTFSSTFSFAKNVDEIVTTTTQPLEGKQEYDVRADFRTMTDRDINSGFNTASTAEREPNVHVEGTVEDSPHTRRGPFASTSRTLPDGWRPFARSTNANELLHSSASPSSKMESMEPAGGEPFDEKDRENTAPEQETDTETDSFHVELYTDPGQHITVIGAASNIFLCGIKGAAGIVAHSPALVADAVHSLTDLMSDAVTLTAVRMSKKKPDANYPFGYGKYEQLGSLGVSGLVCATAAGIGWESVQAIFSPSWAVNPELAPVCISVCFFSVGIKEWLYRRTVQIGRKTQSRVLIANAWHHRSDAWSSIVAALGVAGSSLGVPMLDPAAGCVVALGVFKVGAEIGYTSIVELADRHDDSIEKEVLAVTDGFDLHVSRVRVRKAGPRAFVHMHIMIDPRLSVSAAQYAIAKLKEKIKKRVPNVEEVWIKWSCDSPSVIRRVADLQSQIRGIVSTVPNVLLCSHVSCHFIQPQGKNGLPDDYESNLYTKRVSNALEQGTDSTDFKELLWDDIPQVVAEVCIVSSLRNISDLREQTRDVRQLVLGSMKRSATCDCDCVNVVEVDVKVDLNDGCQFIQVPDPNLPSKFRACSPHATEI